MRRWVLVALLTAGCSDDLPRPYRVDNLRILGVKAEPPEGPVGTDVVLDSLVLHPDPAEDVERLWLACVSQPEVQATICGGIPTDGSAPPLEMPPLCSANPEAAFCAIGFGSSVEYRLPARARKGRAPGDSGQIVVTMIAALESAGGLDGCLDAFTESGRLPETCRIAVKRLNVLPDGAVANRNPELESLTIDGDEVLVRLSDGSIETTPDGPEDPFFSWFVTAGELADYRTDGEDGLANRWTPADTMGRIVVVVRDGRGGEGWISGRRDEDTLYGCNGHVELCDRRLDEVAFAGTHNSHASAERYYNPAAMNQFEAVPTQLADGIRYLNFDVYHYVDEETDDLWVCHGFCELGYQRFVDILGEVEAFLATHPREVVLLRLESYITAEQAGAAFAEAGLDAYAHEQAYGEPWPTLGELIAGGKRLVVLTSDDPSGWYLDEDRLVYGTAWGASRPEELTCDTSPAIPNGLFEIVHTLNDPIATPELAETINHNPFLRDRVLACRDAVGHIPNVVQVDFYSIGDVLGVVDELNAVD